MIYALDFDGVICDSIHECFHNTYQAFRLVRPELDLPSEPKTLWQKKFFEHRGLVRPARNFYLLWNLIVSNHQIGKSTIEFESDATNYEHILILFDEEFMSIREEQLKSDLQAFLIQNPLFPAVKELWGDLPRPIYIVTAKDERITRLILEYNGLNVDGVFGKGTGHKHQTLLRLAKSHDVAVSSVYFVDDNPEFVREADSIGVKTALSNWGYGPYGPEHGKSLDSFEQVLGFFNNEQ
jgi:phosphoglycolate phosphatase-like HAD superfamily hydrolase